MTYPLNCDTFDLVGILEIKGCREGQEDQHFGRGNSDLVALASMHVFFAKLF